MGVNCGMAYGQESKLLSLVVRASVLFSQTPQVCSSIYYLVG